VQRSAHREVGVTVHFNGYETVMKRLFLTSVAALFLATGAAHATEDFCAVVLKTPDGFLALREGPSTRFKMITKLHRGDFLLADTGGTLSPKWTHVIGVPRIDSGDAHYTRGFVYRRYIQEFLCPEDQAAEGD
jgi:hypothetical protein